MRCRNKVLRPIEWQGCERTYCENPEDRQRLMSLTDLKEGVALPDGTLTRATKRLLQLEYFERVDVQCTPDAAGFAQVRLVVVGNHFVRRVDFIGNAQVFEDELRGKMLIRNGDILNPLSIEAKTALNLQSVAIVGLYQRYGFDNAHVTLTTEAIDEQHPYDLKLLVHIEEGLKQRVTATHFRIEPLPPPTDEEERAGLVCPKVTERAVRDVSELQNVEVFTKRAANKARNNIRAYLRRLGFANPQVGIPDPRDNVIDIAVRPGRCHLIRVFLREEAGQTRNTGFHLVTQDDDTELYESLPFAESGLFEIDDADRGRTALAGTLENRGYLFADVRLDWRPVPPVLSTQVETAITYYVTTGFVSQIRGIQFPGKGDLDEDQMKGVISTKAYDLLNTGGFLQVDQLLADLESLKQFYVAAGYYHFHYPFVLPTDVTPTADHTRTVTVTPEGTTFEYRFKDRGFRIKRPPDEDFIYVEIPVEPGQRTHIGQLNLVGVQALTPADVLENFDLKAGEVVSYDLLSQAVAQVERRYKNTGYFRARVTPLCTGHSPDHAEMPCTFEGMQSQTVDVRLVVEEGERVEIGEVFVRGNFETDTAVILRDMPKAGSAYSAEALFESQRRLRNLGLFSQVTFDYVGEDETPPRQRLGVVVEVSENAFRWMEYAAGVQTISRYHINERTVPPLLDGAGQATASGDRAAGAYNQGMTLNLPNLLLTGEAAWVNRNFLHSGKQLRIPLKLGLARSPTCGPGTVACEDQNVLDTLRLISFTPTYTDSRLFGSDVTLTLTAPYFVHDYASGVVDLDRTGALAQLARRFGKLTIALAMDAGFIRTRALNISTPPDGFTLKPQYQVNPTATWDRTDSPINPTKGFYLASSLQYINALRQVVASPHPELIGTYQPGNYLKYELTAKGYLPLGQLILAMMAHAGGSQSLGGEGQDLPDWARYQLGGVQGLRGFADLGVREYLRDGTTKSLNGAEAVSSSDPSATSTKLGGNVVLNGSAELRFPILRETGVWGAGFWDWGGIADSFGEVYPASFRHGLGLGLRWLLSGQIPIRLDYGVAVGKRVRDIVNHAVVLDDFGALSFSVMYSF